MANVSRIFGFRPSRYMNSSEYNGMASLYGFSASETNVCFKGDVVQFDATNRATALADPYAPGIPLLTVPVAALTTNAIRGVVAGFVPQPEYNMSVTASLGTMYRLASTARYAWVVDDFDVVFETQESGNSWVSASNNGINKNVDLSYAAGSTITGISGSQIATFTTNAAKPFRALRLTQRVDNFNFAATDTNSYAKFDVMIANSDLGNALNGA